MKRTTLLLVLTTLPTKIQLDSPAGPARLAHALVFLALMTFAAISGARAAQIDLVGPAGSGQYGTSVTVLPNGNFVVTDPGYNAPGPIEDVGAVYLYNGVTLAVISILTGSTANDHVGVGVTLLSNGNYVVSNPRWNGARGAVTWGSATTGVTGVVSVSNSLVGSAPGDYLGDVIALKNGNYLVNSPARDTGAMGAVTWGSGTTGVSGVVSASNSLVSSTPFDYVLVLNNGNYVVASSGWNGSRGAVTWGNGTIGATGLISAANSLVGTASGDSVGFNGLTALSNGNYVVTSWFWKNGAATNAGAVTWGCGTTGVTGAVTAANSLVGSKAEDFVGRGGFQSRGVIALANGNYVVSSMHWDNEAAPDAGAVTWGSGATGVTGPVSAANSLVGSTAGDYLGSGGIWDYSGVIALNNGNYVVSSSFWDNGPVVDAGAVTWGDGTTGATGVVTAANSLVGSKAEDWVGSGGFSYSGGVIALANGNYVVSSSHWDNGAVVDVGAVTWGNGTTGVTGMISASNSLVGSTTGDFVGSVNSDGYVISTVTALNNGNYVVGSSAWSNGAATNAGAVTWGSGATGVTGPVSAANSLVGSTAGDYLGNGGIWDYSGVIALNNGNYVVISSFWDNGLVVDAGAVTWGSGMTGVIGAVTAANSLVGSTARDELGSYGVTPLSNGNYVVSSPYWDNGAATNAGAVTWGNGATGAIGAVTAANSLVGSATYDFAGGATYDFAGAHPAVTPLTDGNYMVSSPYWDNGAGTNAGAVTWGHGMLGTSGTVSAANSVVGTVTNGGYSMNVSYDLLNARLLVGYPSGNRVSLFIYTPVIAIALIPEGIRLRFTGIPGHSYNIQRAPAVTGPWSILATPTAPFSGFIEHTDTNAPQGTAFYRTSAP